METVETAQSLNNANNCNNQNIIQQKQQNVPEKKDETGTTISNINFLTKFNKEGIIENLNGEIQKDTISTSTGTSSNNSQQENTNLEKKSFAGKTKKWAGNVWNSLKNIKLKKIFPKQEFKEFRNANGDLVKIPVKKIPLKKKKELNNNTKMIISKEKDKDINNYNYAAEGMFIFY